MEKAKQRARDIQFFSNKNETMILVHSAEARNFAKGLEENSWIAKYETCVSLDMQQYAHVSPIDIRADYLKSVWVSDFLLTYADGRKGIVELVKRDQLLKRAVCEKLELSRRYWAALDIKDWKVRVVA